MNLMRRQEPKSLLSLARASEKPLPKPRKISIDEFFDILANRKLLLNQEYALILTISVEHSVRCVPAGWVISWAIYPPFLQSSFPVVSSGSGIIMDVRVIPCVQQIVQIHDFGTVDDSKHAMSDDSEHATSMSITPFGWLVRRCLLDLGLISPPRLTRPLSNGPIGMKVCLRASDSLLLLKCHGAATRLVGEFSDKVLLSP